jgi:hypothetical protein
MKPQTQQPEPLRPPVVVPGAFTDPVPMPEIEEEDNYENKLHQPAGPQIEDRLEMPLRKEAEPAPEPTPAPQPERPTHMNAAQIEAQTREPLSMAKRELARCEGEVSKSRAEYQAKKAALEEAQKTIAAFHTGQQQALDRYQKACETESHVKQRISELESVATQAHVSRTGAAVTK